MKLSIYRRVRRKRKALRLMLRGWTCGEAAEEVGVTVQAARNWWANFKLLGEESIPEQRRGRPRKVVGVE